MEYVHPNWYNKNTKFFIMFTNIQTLIAVCIYRYVITLGLWNKYDIDGHYSRFVAHILANPCEIRRHVAMLHAAVVFCMQ